MQGAWPGHGLKEAELGPAEGGPTYFDTVLEVFADHPRIELVLA